jgi:hypothetical protein
MKLASNTSQTVVEDASVHSSQMRAAATGREPLRIWPLLARIRWRRRDGRWRVR